MRVGEELVFIETNALPGGTLSIAALAAAVIGDPFDVKVAVAVAFD